MERWREDEDHRPSTCVGIFEPRALAVFVSEPLYFMSLRVVLLHLVIDYRTCDPIDVSVHDINSLLHQSHTVRWFLVQPRQKVDRSPPLLI